MTYFDKVLDLVLSECNLFCFLLYPTQRDHPVLSIKWEVENIRTCARTQKYKQKILETLSRSGSICGRRNSLVFRSRSFFRIAIEIKLVNLGGSESGRRMNGRRGISHSSRDVQYVNQTDISVCCQGVQLHLGCKRDLFHLRYQTEVSSACSESEEEQVIPVSHQLTNEYHLEFLFLLFHRITCQALNMNFFL